MIGTTPKFKILIWNAQDWRNGVTQSDVSKRRGNALEAMLRLCSPHLVVLLETGTAGQENTYIKTHLKGFSSYSDPEFVSADDCSSLNDKGLVYFFDKSLKGCFSVGCYPIGEKERRPALVFQLQKPMYGFQAFVTFAFAHNIAQKTAARDQSVELLRNLVSSYKAFVFYGGDMNHAPEGLYSLPYKALAPANNTHSKAGGQDAKILDWAYLHTDTNISATATTISSITVTSNFGPSSKINIWKGESDNDSNPGASDHAAVYYELSYGG